MQRLALSLFALLCMCTSTPSASQVKVAEEEMTYVEIGKAFSELYAVGKIVCGGNSACIKKIEVDALRFMNRQMDYCGDLAIKLAVDDTFMFLARSRDIELTQEIRKYFRDHQQAEATFCKDGRFHFVEQALSDTRADKK